MRASSTCEVTFDNCIVSEKDVLGQVGKGYKIAIEGLNEGRIGIGAQMLGLGIGCFEAVRDPSDSSHFLRPYLTSRRGNNLVAPLLLSKECNLTLLRYVKMRQGSDLLKLATDIEAAKLLVYNAARLREEGKPFVQEASIAKLYASQMAERVSSKCVEMMGGVGFTKDFPIEKFYRDCKIGQIYEGTTNIQYQTIAKNILKAYDD